MAKLETEKKPILQRRNEAKSASELCEREVNAVQRRIDENDAVDQEFAERIVRAPSAIRDVCGFESQSPPAAA